MELRQAPGSAERRAAYLAVKHLQALPLVVGHRLIMIVWGEEGRIPGREASAGAAARRRA